MSRSIAHLDMDAFFASVELRRRPELRGKPVVVANNRSRAVVAAATYEARKFGVRSALPLVTARRLCPGLITVPADMERYRAISAQVMELLAGYSDRIEVAGLDEAYIDLSGSPAPKSRARGMKNDVRARTGLVCSIGLGPNKLVAKIASDLDKPDGFRSLTAAEFLPAVEAAPARIIPGVGPRTEERLAAIGIETVAQLAAADPGALIGALGPGAPALAQRAQGIDDRELEVDRVRKSESRETTFAEDVRDYPTLERTLAELAEEVMAGLGEEELEGRTVTIKVRQAPFETHTRSRTLPSPVADASRLASVAVELLRAFAPAAPVRLIGVGVSSLGPVGGNVDGPEEPSAALRLPI